MRYELRLNAYDYMDRTHINASLWGTPDDPGTPTLRVWATTATTLQTDSPEATEWIREVLETMLAAL